nr:hypothetical protein [Tanacetum cinerariifolium]
MENIDRREDDDTTAMAANLASSPCQDAEEKKDKHQIGVGSDMINIIEREDPVATTMSKATPAMVANALLRRHAKMRLWMQAQLEAQPVPRAITSTTLEDTPMPNKLDFEILILRPEDKQKICKTQNDVFHIPRIPIQAKKNKTSEELSSHDDEEGDEN